MAGFDALPARGVARRRVPPLRAGGDLCRQPRAGARRAGRAAPGPRLRAALSAQRRRRRMSAAAPQLRLLEALLFAAAEPLSEEFLAARLGPEADIAALIAELAAQYAGRGVELVRAAGGWAFRTAADLAPLLRPERPVSRSPAARSTGCWRRAGCGRAAGGKARDARSTG